MSMIAPEAEAVGSKIGLTGGQKAGALSGALPQPRTHHPYVVGLVFIVTGMFMLVGSITGTLPSMIAGLFDPNALEDSNHNTPTPFQSSSSGLGFFTSTGAGSLYSSGRRLLGLHGTL